MKSASAEMNVHSWQGLVSGTRGHQIRYLDKRYAQNPKCIVLSPKHVYTPARRNSGLSADTVFPRQLLVAHFFEISDEFRRDVLSGCAISICRNERTQLAGSCSRYMWPPDPLSRSKIYTNTGIYRTFSQTCLHSCET